MANRELLVIRPFEGVNLSTEPYYLKPGVAAQADNCDISYRFGTMTTAKGRQLLNTFPASGVEGLAQFSTFLGDNPTVAHRLYVYSLTDGTVGYLDGNVNTILPNARRFTQAVQFGSSIWTNGGDRIFYQSGTLISDEGQIQVPYQYSYNITGTWAALTASVDTGGFTVAAVGSPNTIPVVAGYPVQYAVGSHIQITVSANVTFYGVITAEGAGSFTATTLASSSTDAIGAAIPAGTEIDLGAPPGQYTYAITLRRAQSPWPTQGTNPTVYFPDLESLQESSPVFSTSVSVTAGQQPGFTVPSSLGLAKLISGVTIGGQQYYGCLYRSTLLDPTYVFVDYLTNLVQMNDHNGDAAIIDTYSNDQIADNATLIIHRDPPPIIGQTYPGAIANNSGAVQLSQSQQQVSFTYTNPCFLEKHKGRMWLFTLYPAEPVGNAPSLIPDELTLQPQAWCSNYGTPWEYNDDSAQNQVLLVGPEDTPGNGSIDASIATNAPWAPGVLEDTPMGLASTGSYLVLFKSQRAYVVLGDTPSEFIVQQAFDIGCLSTKSITKAEGGIFWLAPQGVYFFNGGSPEYISEDIRGSLEDMLTHGQGPSAVGSYQERSFYLSFATVTFVYYLPTKKWYTLPYGCELAVSSPYNTTKQLVWVNLDQLQNVGVLSSNDLGSAIVATWKTGVTDSEAPGQLKTYRYIQVVAPVQPGTVKLTLTLDANAAITNVFEATFDLSKGNGAHVASIPQALQGYEAQVTVVATTDVASDPASSVIIRSVVVTGDVNAALTTPQTNDIYTAYLNGKMVYPHG